MCHLFFLAAQLFSEVSLRTLLSYAASPSPALPKLLSAVEQHTSPTPTLSNAAHTLSLPLLHTILVKMREASSELRSSAAATLCKASHSYTHTTGDDAQVNRLLLYTLHHTHHNPLHHTHDHYITITSHYITITSFHYHYITITSPLRFAYTITLQLHPCIFTICSCRSQWLIPCDCSLH